MRIFSFSILFFAGIQFSLLAQDPVSEMERFSNHGEVYFSLVNPSSIDLKDLPRGIYVDQITKTGRIYAYASNQNLVELMSVHSRADIELLPHPGTRIEPEMVAYVDLDNPTDWDFYPTYEAYVDLMYQFQEDYPGLCQVFSIGQSVEGRELLMAVISDDNEADNPEPQVLFTSSMHGDEVTGFVLFLRLVHYLLANYETDMQVKNLVDNLQIWINPLANPDGTYAGGNESVFGATRLNANGVDLNRNYPDPEDGDHPDYNAWQVETVHFMNLAAEQDFVIAVNCHGGAEVFNYPWDTWEQLPADDGWWNFVGREWADTVHAYGPSWYFHGFDDGVSNGYQWYSINGGRQDYMNFFHHCREFTLEITDVKMPASTQLPDYWEYNYRSFLNYMGQALYGINGSVYDAGTGDPLEASVFIEDHDVDGSWVIADKTGWFFRPVIEGVYDLTFFYPGYESVTIEGVQAMNYAAVTLDVAMNYTGSGLAENTMVSFFVPLINPSAGIFRVAYLGAELMEVDMVVTDGQGRQVFHSIQRAGPGFPALEVNLGSEDNGLYLLHLRSGKQSASLKLIKE